MLSKHSAYITDLALLQKLKNIRLPYVLTNAALILSVIITIVKVLMDGAASFVFTPVFFIAIVAFIIRVNYKAVEKEIKARKLVK